MDDDGMLLWLNDRSAEATSFAKQYLLSQSGKGTDITGKPTKSFTNSGLSRVYAGKEAASYFGVKPGDARVPDLFGIAKYGVVYTGGTKKIAEHGGAHADDLNVPLVISGAGTPAGVTKPAQVETTQIAPTILSLLGLNPHDLQAVQKDHTQVLPVR
ncbi:hypothetical protein ACQ4WX_39780 [Streptomyces lasalocidi]